MFPKHPIENSSKSVLDVEKLPSLVRDLNEQEQTSISGGQIQRLQEEFAAELATLGAMALPSLLNPPRKIPR